MSERSGDDPESVELSDMGAVFLRAEGGGGGMEGRTRMGRERKRERKRRGGPGRERWRCAGQSIRDAGARPPIAIRPIPAPLPSSPSPSPVARQHRIHHTRQLTPPHPHPIHGPDNRTAHPPQPRPPLPSSPPLALLPTTHSISAPSKMPQHVVHTQLRSDPFLR